MKKTTIERFETMDFMGYEAVNTICSNLLFAERNVKKILVTSFGAAEGKSFISRQILWNMAKRGRWTVLLDADLRRSKLVDILGFKTEEPIQGLSHYLAGYCNLDDILYETNVPEAVIAPIGRTVMNPVPLLGQPQFAEMLDTLTESFDTIIIDAPPLGVVIDAAEIASHCDGALIVVEYDKTRRRDLAKVRNSIEQTGCPVLGCVINNVKLDTFGAKRYYNYSHYYE